MDSGIVSLPLPDFAKPLRDALICRRRAEGASFREIGEETGVDKATAHRVATRFEDWVAAQKEEHTRNVLRRLPNATDARLTDASNAESRTGAQSYRVLLESLRWVGNGDTHVHGDVNISAEVIDARRQCLQVDPSRLEELRAKYGG